MYKYSCLCVTTGIQYFAVCPNLCRVQNFGHTATSPFAVSQKKNTRQTKVTWQKVRLPCAWKKTHGKNKTHGKWWEFVMCHDEHTPTWFVCRVPNVWHTANRWPRRAVCLTVGFAVRFNWHTEIKIYAVCFCSLPCD